VLKNVCPEMAATQTHISQYLRGLHAWQTFTSIILSLEQNENYIIKICNKKLVSVLTSSLFK
jgi:hypothetical protein